MPRFIVPQLPDAPALVALPDEEAHHAVRVLRLRAGEAVTLLDGRGGVGQGVLVELSKRSAQVSLDAVERVAPPLPALEIAAAIPKGPRAEAMVEALSQAGVDSLIPLRTRRSVVDPRDHKLDKFQRTADESMKQCGRAHRMTVGETHGLDQTLARPADLRLIAAPAAAPVDGLSEMLARAKTVQVLIGPEGGWDDDELDAARAAGARDWPLGPHVMRIETAATVAAGIVRYFATR